MDHRGQAAGRGLLPRRSARVFSLVFLGCVHLGLLQYFVPLQAVFSDRPLQGVDYDLHIGQVFRVVEALEQEGHAWSYDVQLLAGQPEGTITDAGSKGWELWTYALHRYFGLTRAVAFNSFVLLAMLACPLLLYSAAQLLRLGSVASVVAAAMATLLWYFDSLMHWLWYVGMVSWAFASCLAMLTFAMFYRFCEERRPLLVVLCSLCLSIGLLIHPYTFFALFVPMVVCYARQYRLMGARDHAGIVLMAVCSLVVNAFWLHNAYLHWHYILNSAYFAQARPEFLLCDLFAVLCSASDSGVIGSRAGFRFLIFGLGLGGLWLWRCERDRRFFPVSVSLLALFCVAYFGTNIPGLSQTQPYRQLATAIWLATLPAAYFFSRVIEQWRWSSLTTVSRFGLGVGLFMLTQQLITSQVMYFMPRSIPDTEPLLDGTAPPLTKYGFWAVPNVESHIHYGLPHPEIAEPGVQDVLDFVATNIPPRSRILVEGGLIGERLAWSTDHEILGGFVERNVQHVDANLFRTHARIVVSPLELARYLHVFAVDWVIGNRPEFARNPELLKLVGQVGARKIYRARAHSSRVLRGGGIVAARQNNLDVQGSVSSEPVVLSYHFHEALSCRPNCRVEQEFSEIDRVGFVRVPAPHPSDFTVFNSYDFSAKTAPSAAPGL